MAVSGSNIDPTVPADNVKADKALIRQNFATAQAEITVLQAYTALPLIMAYDDSKFDDV